MNSNCYTKSALYFKFIVIFISLCLKINTSEAQNSWNILTSEDGLISDTIKKIKYFNNGNLVFISDRGFSLFNESDLINIPTSLDRIDDMVIDDAENFWYCGQPSGLYKRNIDINSGQVKVTSSPTDDISSIAIDHQGQIWLGTKTDTILKNSDEKWEIYSKISGVCTENISKIESTEDGSIFFLGLNGCLSRFDGITWDSFRPPDNISIIDFTVDRDGNIWFIEMSSSKEYSLAKFDHSAWTIFPAKGNIPYKEKILCIEVDLFGNVWIGSDVGVSKFNGSLWEFHTESHGLPDSYILSIESDRVGNIWVGTKKGVAQYIQGPTFDPESEEILIEMPMESAPIKDIDITIKKATRSQTKRSKK